MATGLLSGTTAIITGAASGLGRATALAFAKQGASVICADISPLSSQGEETHKIISQAGGKAHFIKTDVSSEVGVKALVENAVEVFGKLDMSVHSIQVYIISKLIGVE